MRELYSEDNQKIEPIEEGMCYDTGKLYKLGSDSVVEINQYAGWRREIFYSRLGHSSGTIMWSRNVITYHDNKHEANTRK